MTTVSIAKLKAQLSKYLRRVKAGEEVVITDHDHPVAKVVPFAVPSKAKLETFSPKHDPADLHELKFSRIAPGFDVVALMLQERAKR